MDDLRVVLSEDFYVSMVSMPLFLERVSAHYKLTCNVGIENKWAYVGDILTGFSPRITSLSSSGRTEYSCQSSVSATPVLPFPPLRALPYDESNLCGESRYTAFGEFSIGHNTKEYNVRAPMFQTSLGIWKALAGDSFSMYYLSMERNYELLKKEFYFLREKRSMQFKSRRIWNEIIRW